MAKSLGSKLFSVLLIASVLVMCPTLGHADGGGSAGNADATICGDLLLDRQIAQGQKSFDPSGLHIFNSDIAPILKVADQLPEFGKALRAALDKKWRFGYDLSGDSGFSICPTENSYLVSPTEKVACQTDAQVIINPDWYEGLTRESCRALKRKNLTKYGAIQILEQKQRDLFVHELLLGITLGKGFSEQSTEAVFEALTRQPPPSASELQSVLESSLFGVYKLASQDGSNTADPCSPGTQPVLKPTAQQNVNDSAKVVQAAAAKQPVCSLAGDAGHPAIFNNGNEYQAYDNTDAALADLSALTHAGICKPLQAVPCSLSGDAGRPAIFINGSEYQVHDNTNAALSDLATLRSAGVCSKP